ncbi:MAG: phosphonate metabolism protein/1,5-bisphosphokinase (PRPP-forming) PhnN [Pseudomonadota bacterium]
MTGPRLAAVVGPSGVGKDSLIAALATADPRLQPIRRVITRPADHTEPFVSASDARFDAMVADDAFLLHWRAHGLRYGVPRAEIVALGPDRTGLVNLSRGVLAEAADAVRSLVILSVTAPAAVLARRLRGRGREHPEEIETRLARPRPAPPSNAPMVEIDNSGPLDRAVDAALAALATEAT